jgi:signal transduction histidine kinase
MKIFWVRTILFLGLWAGLGSWAIPWSLEELEGLRFESLVLSNGRVASLQREYLFKRADLLQPGDWLLHVDGESFNYRRLRERFLDSQAGDVFQVEYLRGRHIQRIDLELREYSGRDEMLFFLFPIILSILFLGFAILTPLQRFNFRRNQEAVEVFSGLCILLSLYFLLFLPSVGFGMPWSGSALLPLFSVVVLHLFCVYPKKKGSLRWRSTFLGTAYALAIGFTVLRSLYWMQINLWASLVEFSWLGFCLIGSVANLGNTLFSSKDFWAKRRARLLSVVFFFAFIAGVSVFVSFLWYGPRISLERLLAGALLFPVGFAVVFSKENVFDLERVFRHGIHQVLFLGIAIVLALVIGLSWQSWRNLSEADWILWSAIAMIVALFARPVGIFAESQINRFLVGRVKFPECEKAFEKAKSLETFVRAFCQACETHLHIQKLEIALVKDPSLPWKKNNEQVWVYENSLLARAMSSSDTMEYRTPLRRSALQIGQISFSGGDGIAFDPEASKDWEKLCASFSRYTELLVLREYVEAQQGLLAVGRMQALLAHEMKNPLAVIQICSGLLREHVDSRPEGQEIVATIEEEVQRISSGLQKIFDHSGKDEPKSAIEVRQILSDMEIFVRRRFPQKKLVVEWLPADSQAAELRLWAQKEAFRQSLLNLVINAFEAGAQEVRIVVEDQPGASLRILVSDNGPGIPTHLELFKPFVTTKPTGTGLGLSQVKGFVDRHEGRIEVFRSKGPGASFLMEFGAEYRADIGEGELR